MLEKDIEKKVCDYAKTQGWLAYKFTSPSRRNVPDRLLFTPQGMPVMIEFKAEGKLPSEGQVREMKRLNACNVSTYVVDNVPDGKQLIDDISAALNPPKEEEASVIITL